MSGARALAAARRRRASPDDRRNNNQQRAPIPQPPPPPNQQQQQIKNKKMDPRTMLLQNNSSIKNLEMEVVELKNHTNNIDEKIDSYNLDENNIMFFKNKIALLENELREIKKHIIKVQSFAMETNLQYMKSLNKSNTTDEILKESNNISNMLYDDNNDIEHKLLSEINNEKTIYSDNSLDENVQFFNNDVNAVLKNDDITS